MSTTSLIIRTTGHADISEHIEFVTKNRLIAGDTVQLKPTKPISADVYGSAYVLRYLGPGRDQAHRKYEAIRIS